MVFEINKPLVPYVKCIRQDNMLLLLVFILVSVFTVFDVSEGQGTVPWYENLPAVAMDYKVHIDPGKEDCYFQYVNPGATFYVSFQVSKNFSKRLFFCNKKR